MGKKKEEIEDQVEHIMITKGKLWFGVITILIPIISFFIKIQYDVKLIKENHFTHIENIYNNIEDLKKADTELRQQYNELLKSLIKE